jgi:arylsulfatase A-like enzyme
MPPMPVTLGVLLLVAAAAAASSPASAAAPHVGRPNFIFVLADDWGYGDTAPYKTLLNHNLDEPATPRLQKMADEGTLYTNFHTLGAECSPSRASWMTGRSPSDRLVRISLVIGNHRSNKGKGIGDYVPTSTPTVFSTMQHAGYFVAHYGKW